MGGKAGSSLTRQRKVGGTLGKHDGQAARSTAGAGSGVCIRTGPGGRSGAGPGERTGTGAGCRCGAGAGVRTGARSGRTRRAAGFVGRAAGQLPGDPCVLAGQSAGRAPHALGAGPDAGRDVRGDRCGLGGQFDGPAGRRLAHEFARGGAGADGLCLPDGGTLCPRPAFFVWNLEDRGAGWLHQCTAARRRGADHAGRIGRAAGASAAHRL